MGSMATNSTKRRDKLNEKIAAFLGTSVEEIEKKTGVYTTEEMAYEGQSVINYYTWRTRPEQMKDEKDSSYDNRLREWKYRECKFCKGRFAYSYKYDSVAYCSLDCLDGALREIGLKVSFGRNLKQRWGLYHPAIVPSTALEAIEQRLASSESSVEEPDVLDE